MAYLSLVADFFGVIFGIYFAGIEIKPTFQNERKKPNEDEALLLIAAGVLLIMLSGSDLIV